MTYSITCKCGWKTEHQNITVERAQVIADRHESQFVQRPYRHDAVYVAQGR